MKLRILGTFLMGATLLLAGSKTAKPAPGSDQAIAAQVRQDVVTYGDYTVFDEVSFGIRNGQVELNGVVSDAAKKTGFEKLVRSVRGVTGVTDHIRVLSDSLVDQQLRARVANTIYNDQLFGRLGTNEQGPIHILVDHDQVTLQGTVSTEFEKDAAGERAGIAWFQSGPVINNLQVQAAAQQS